MIICVAHMVMLLACVKVGTLQGMGETWNSTPFYIAILIFQILWLAMYWSQRKSTFLPMCKSETVSNLVSDYIRMEGAMATMSHSDFKCPIGKGSMETMSHYFLAT